MGRCAIPIREILAGGIEFVDALQTAVWIFDIDHSRVVWANPAALHIWRSPSVDELTSRDMGVDMSPAVAKRLRQYQRDFRDHNASFVERWTLYPAGEPVSLDVHYSPHHFPDARVGMLCEAHVALEQTPDALRSADALLHTSVMITLYDTNGVALYRNAAARAASPTAAATFWERFANALERQSFEADLAASDDVQHTARVHTAAGERWHDITARRALDPSSGERALLVSEINVTQLKETEAHAHYLANRDVLTGLFNRHYLLNRAPGLIDDARLTQSTLAVIIVDLDNFKLVNDTRGHAVGDQLLVRVAQALESLVADRGFAVRLGGDEFLLFIEAARDHDDVEGLCSRMIHRFACDRDIESMHLGVKFSIGASVFPEHGDTLSDLMKNADLALYQAKLGGKNTYRLFSRALRDERDARARLEKALTDALENDQFELFFQPRVSVETDDVVGAEALIRWRRPDGELISPDAFIPVCEETGLIVPLGAWVLEASIEYQRRLKTLGRDLTISVNVSPHQFTTPGFAETLSALLATTQCEPERLELEITESMIVKDDQSNLELLERIRAIGFGLAIDDFGTGYSNLVYLQSFPITSLKIDKSFIQTIGSNRSVAGLVMSFSRVLGVKAVAEGVETDAQLGWLRGEGCAEYQGFLFSRPLARDGFEKLIGLQAAA